MMNAVQRQGCGRALHPSDQGMLSSRAGFKHFCYQGEAHQCVVVLVAVFQRQVFDVGQSGLSPSQESPPAYGCLLFIKAIIIWFIKTNSLSFALLQKLLLSLNHDLFFSFPSTLLSVIMQQPIPRNEELHAEVKAAIKRRNYPQDRPISVNGEGDVK